MSSEPAKLHLFADTRLAVCSLEGMLLCLSDSQQLGTVYNSAGKVPIGVVLPGSS